MRLTRAARPPFTMRSAYVLADPLKKLRGERTAMVVISDGDDNKSFVPFPAILEAISRVRGVDLSTVCSFGVDSRVERATDLKSTIDPLRTQISDSDNAGRRRRAKTRRGFGWCLLPDSPVGDLQRAYDDVVVQLRTAYTITYASKRDPRIPRAYVCALTERVLPCV